MPILTFEALLTVALWMGAIQLRGLTGLENAPDASSYWQYGLVLAVLTVSWFSRYGLYRDLRLGGHKENNTRLLQAHFAAVLSFIFLIYFLGVTRVSRITIAIYFVLAALTFLLTRTSLRQLLFWRHTKGGDTRRLVFVGSGEALGDYLKVTQASPAMGLKVTGWFDAPEWARALNVPILTELPASQKSAHIDAYVVSYASHETQKLDAFLHRHYDELTSIYVLPNLRSFALVGLSLERFAGIPILSLNQPQHSNFDLAVKRLIDIAGAVAGLILLSPLLLTLGLLVKLTSAGPMIFGQERMGLDGTLFTMWKFRTMKPGPAEPGWTVANDPRRTKFGTFLRRTSLDELPQLWNVLVGEMSLVGPRPEQPFFVEKFRQEIPAYMLRHKVKSGITGWAQVMGWRGDTPLKERIECDLYYIRNWSLGLDLKILFLTVRNGIIHDNAY